MPKFQDVRTVLIIKQIQDILIYSAVELVWNCVESDGCHWGKYADLPLAIKGILCPPLYISPTQHRLAIIHNGNIYLLNSAFPSAFLPDPHAMFYLRNCGVCGWYRQSLPD